MAFFFLSVFVVVVCFGPRFCSGSRSFPFMKPDNWGFELTFTERHIFVVGVPTATRGGLGTFAAFWKEGNKWYKPDKAVGLVMLTTNLTHFSITNLSTQCCCLYRLRTWYLYTCHHPALIFNRTQCLQSVLDPVIFTPFIFRWTLFVRLF